MIRVRAASSRATSLRNEPSWTQPQAAQGLPSEPCAPPRQRVWLVHVLIWVTTVVAVFAIFAVWADRLLLNPSNWGKTSARLLQNPAVRDATSNYLVDQLYANVDVAGALKSKLPTALAAPITGGIRNLAATAARQALAASPVQNTWKQANQAADQTFVTIVNGGDGALQVNRGQVSLNLAAIVADITNRLGLPNLGSKLPPRSRTSRS